MSERPDYKRWLRKPVWRLYEAVALLLVVDPEDLLEGVLDETLDSQLLDECEDLLDNAERAANHGTLKVERYPREIGSGLYTVVEKLEFLKWVKKEGYSIPPELLEFIEESESKSMPEPEDAEQEITTQEIESIPNPQEEKSKTPMWQPSDLKVTVDDVNQKVTVLLKNGGKTIYTKNDIVGRGIVTWTLLVAFAKCKGSLEGNAAADVKKVNTSVNRKNLGGKLVDAMNLDESPIVEGRNGIMRFHSIQLAGGPSSTDAMDRKTCSCDDQATEYLRRHGDDMPVND